MQPEPRGADELEAAVDQAIAACGGNMRATIRGLIIANNYQEAEVCDPMAAVSHADVRGRFQPIPDKIGLWPARATARQARLFLAPTPTRCSLPTKISKTTPCKVKWGRWHGCFSLRKHFDTSGKSPALLQHRATFRPLKAPAKRAVLARLQAKNPDN
jgi:hypothetical protein